MRIAVIGSGISGISPAWFLSPDHHVDIYEAANYLGGHTRTIFVSAGDTTFPVDTGFMVFNRRTYPNLTRFFDHLGVRAHDADMSFSARVNDVDIEWSGTDLNTVFAQRQNLANPKFLRMLRDVLRFSRQADRLLSDPTTARLTLGQLLQREGYGDAFRDWYLIPMGSAIWSTPPGEMLNYPADTFLRFCDNHGLLHVLGKPLWLSVDGGAATYIEKALVSLSGEVFTAEPAERVERTATGIRVSTPKRTEEYDIAIIAAHPPETLAMLGAGVHEQEAGILGRFSYWHNDVSLHTDESFLPRRRRAWASWNWFSSSTTAPDSRLVLNYQINTLQNLPAGAPTVIETLNSHREPQSGTLLRSLKFEHPMFTEAAISAQRRLDEIQGADRLYFTGAWTRYGFHEDGILSGVRVAEALGATVPWGHELNAFRTAPLPGAHVPLMGQTRTVLESEMRKTQGLL